MFSVVPLTVTAAGGEDTVSSLSAYVGPAGEVICEVSAAAAVATSGPVSASRESVPASIAARRRGFGST